MTDLELKCLVSKWQFILRLQDWDIFSYFKKSYELGKQQGSVGWSATKNIATVLVLDPADWDSSNDEPQDIELTVVHELLHLQFARTDDTFDFDSDKTGERQYEVAIDRLSRALVALDRKTDAR